MVNEQDCVTKAGYVDELPYLVLASKRNFILLDSPPRLRMERHRLQRESKPDAPAVWTSSSVILRASKVKQLHVCVRRAIEPKLKRANQTTKLILVPATFCGLLGCKSIRHSALQTAVANETRNDNRRSGPS